MSKRIFIRKFRFYLHLGSLPLLVCGLVLAIYPQFFLKYMGIDSLALSALLFFRINGIYCIYTFFTLVYLGMNPTYNRDLAFFQSLLFLVLGIFFSISPFFWNFSYFVWGFSLYLFIYGIFLLMFSSKNLLVRE
ncbi:MAG: hypothetical protein ACK4UJ_08480 [Leptonema sp. (in: bacteria)]